MQKNSEYRLKSCPFCGSQARAIQAWDGMYRAECSSCGIGTERYLTQITAIRRWNQRLVTNKATWISVKDKLPEAVKFCFVACHEWDMFEDAMSSTIHFRVLQYLPDVGCWNIKTPVQVLAWMPIPELPEE